MLRAYFDTNVYSALADEGRVSAEDKAALKAAVTRGALVAPVSLANIDELMGDLETDRLAMVRRLAVMRGLVGFHGMLKQPRDLLRDAIEAYAAGVEPPPVTLPEAERRKVVLFLADVVAGSTWYDRDLKQIVEGVGGGLKGSWLTGMLDAQQRALSDPALPPARSARGSPSSSSSMPARRTWRRTSPSRWGATPPVAPAAWAAWYECPRCGCAWASASPRSTRS